jgi:hypothetical protein
MTLGQNYLDSLWAKCIMASGSWFPMILSLFDFSFFALDRVSLRQPVEAFQRVAGIADVLFAAAGSFSVKPGTLSGIGMTG